jgi:hypothetical protein
MNAFTMKLEMGIQGWWSRQHHARCQCCPTRDFFETFLPAVPLSSTGTQAKQPRAFAAYFLDKRSMSRLSSEDIINCSVRLASSHHGATCPLASASLIRRKIMALPSRFLAILAFLRLPRSIDWNSANSLPKRRAG